MYGKGKKIANTTQSELTFSSESSKDARESDRVNGGNRIWLSPIRIIYLGSNLIQPCFDNDWIKTLLIRDIDKMYNSIMYDITITIIISLCNAKSYKFKLKIYYLYLIMMIQNITQIQPKKI